MLSWHIAFALSAFAFNASSTTLEEAFQSALQKNEVVGQSRERVVQAEELVEQAESAPYPTLSFHASHLIQPQPKDPIAREFFPENQTTANFTLIQPLFRGFREFAALRARRNLLNSERQERLSTLNQLYERVATTFLDVLALEKDLENLKDQSEIYAARVKELVARGRRGESAPNEALTAQSTEATVLAEISMVTARLRTARESLHFLTNLPADAKLKDKETNISALKPLEDYLSRVDKRPDVIGAKEKVEAADEEVSIARGAHWPTADVVGNYYLIRPEGFMNQLDWDVKFQLTFPLFEGGLRQAQTREQSSKWRSAQLEYSKLRRQAETQIRALHDDLKMRENQLEALKRSAELSKRNYQALQRDYRRGLTRNIDVQLALTEFGITRRAYDQARFAARLDRIRLESAAAIFPAILEGTP